jgi:dephospho-CoA kinase
MARRLRIGLTGGIASGKSTAAARFAELGVPVIDADEVARAVVVPGEAGYAQILERFGRGIIAEAGELDRRALRDRVFADPQQRRDLEAILHPLIRVEMERRENLASGPYVVFAIPLLVESGARDRVDRILVVDAEEPVQLERLVRRDGGTLEQAQAILAAQASRASRLSAADDVLANVGSVAELRHAVDLLHERYLSLAAAKSRRPAD